MRERRLAIAVVVIAAVLPYLPSLDYYFAQDDFGVVWALYDKPWTQFFEWFRAPWLPNVWGYTPDEVRPFPALSYQLAAQLGAAAPWPNHAINIALHAANALLTFAMARHVARLSTVAAGVAGVVFAVLPMQTESVAWITGRVDSMPACLFLTSFLLFVRWRLENRDRLYWWSLVFCFLALFSKQNTVTLGPTLVVADLLVLRRPVRVSWAWMRPYVPFAVMTAAYLALRYVLFGEVAREGSLNANQLAIFAGDLSTHLKRMIVGETGVAMEGARVALAVVGTLVAVTMVGVARGRDAVAAASRPAVFFGVAWIGFAIAPTIVAGYASPRHMYLASVGWAILVGLGYSVLAASAPTRVMRVVASVVVVALIAWYGRELRRDLALWQTRTEVSRLAANDLAREAAALPDGALILVDAPGRSWNFSLPYAVRPPFTARDDTRRVGIVMHSSIYCCPANVWEPAMRGLLRDWLANPARPPVVALHWDADTGALSRVSESEEPYLRPLMQILLESPTVATFDARVVDIGARFVKGRGAGRRGQVLK